MDDACQLALFPILYLPMVQMLSRIGDFAFRISKLLLNQLGVLLGIFRRISEI